MSASLGVTGYPVIQLMALVETGTRALPGAALGPAATGELDWARQLLYLPGKTMLVLMVRGFDLGDFLAEVAGTGAQFLVRLNASRRLPVLRYLPDGSFTSVIGALGARGHLPRAAPHPPAGPDPALRRPRRAAAGSLGPPRPLPGTADRSHRRHPGRPRDRPRPGQQSR